MSRRLGLLAALAAAVVLAWAAWQGWGWWQLHAIYQATDGEAAPILTPRHVAALRKLRFTWNVLIESGGPTVDPMAPYGSADPAEDLGPILGTSDPAAVARFHREVSSALIWALEHCDLPPGDYRLAHLDNAGMETALRDGLAGLPAARIDAVLATLPRLAPDGVFHATEQHRLLLREMRFEWPRSDLMIPVAGTGTPVPAIHFKRPFGDMSFFELDMARILGLPAPAPDRVDPLYDRLYWEMWPALQAFVESAPIGPECR